MKNILLLLVKLTSFFLCCILLGEFFLPPSNNLPLTYSKMCLTLEDIGMVYQDIDPCLDDHIIYYGQYASETKLPQCKINR